jgi:hypothetical protein
MSEITLKIDKAYDCAHLTAVPYVVTNNIDCGCKAIVYTIKYWAVMGLQLHNPTLASGPTVARTWRPSFGNPHPDASYLRFRAITFITKTFVQCLWFCLQLQPNTLLHTMALQLQ